MNDRNPNVDPWDRNSYETGSTRPPKSRGGIIALLLMAVIVLLGITTMMGILNIRLFAQNQQAATPTGGDGMIFRPDRETEASAAVTDPAVQIPDGSNTRLEISSSPESVENIPQEGGLSLQAIYEKNIDSVVSIRCALPDGTASGTGVIFSRDGYIVTNCHVVESADEITVTLTDERSFSARLVGEDALSDLAVLYIDAADLIPAEFGNSASLRVGDAVAAIGDPLGTELRGSMTDGIVSAINRDVTVGNRTMTLIQTNAALNSGNSGGPLINCYGQVIGINTVKISAFADESGVEGLGFAIPSTVVQQIVNQLMDQGYVSGRPSLGIAGKEVSIFYQMYYRMPQGLYIDPVTAGSDAETAGLRPGDILMRLDGV